MIRTASPGRKRIHERPIRHRFARDAKCPWALPTSTLGVFRSERVAVERRPLEMRNRHFGNHGRGQNSSGGIIQDHDFRPEDRNPMLD